LVHTFNFKRKNKIYYFVWDNESGTLLQTDKAAFLYAKKRYNTNTIHDSRFTIHDVGINTNNTNTIHDSRFTMHELEQEFLALEQQDILNCPPAVTEFKKEVGFVKAMCLHVSNDCNMRCAYCFADPYIEKNSHMPFDVARAAVDFLIENSGSRQNLEIDFFGGEPLLNIDVVKKTVAYARERAAKAGKEFLFTLTTNALGLNQENIAFLNREMQNVILSLDGREQTNNNVRAAKNGKPVFKTVFENILSFKKARENKDYYVRGTVTASNLDFCNDVKFLHENGLNNLSLEPVVLPAEHPLALTEKHLPRLNLEYEKLANLYLDIKEKGGNLNFFHFMVDLKSGPCLNKRLTGCGAGTEYLAVSPSGELYPCHQFLNDKEYLLGDVFNGVKRQDLREKFASLTVLTKPHCKDCFAKYYCGGACAANGKSFSKDLNGEYKLGCDLLKKRLEIALALSAIENDK
jgi:uncharacterized protein